MPDLVKGKVYQCDYKSELFQYKDVRIIGIYLGMNIHHDDEIKQNFDLDLDPAKDWLHFLIQDPLLLPEEEQDGTFATLISLEDNPSCLTIKEIKDYL